MIKTKVVHLKREAFDIRIDRQTEWGNPFIIGRDGTREQVIEKYRRWLLTQKQLLAKIHTLKGKVLGCWCKPAACHGDILARLAEESDELLSSECW